MAPRFPTDRAEKRKVLLDAPTPTPDVLPMGNQPHKTWPPLTGHRSAHPDATAPDGSEIRLLIDSRHLAQHASLVEVVVAAGQVSRPVWHRKVEEAGTSWKARGRSGAARPTPRLGRLHRFRWAQEMP